ncbi:DNA polymerase III subunit epsilon [Citromicrobium bathyomarinum]
MSKSLSLDMVARVNSGVAVDRSGDDALAVAVGDVGTKVLIGTDLGEVALAGDDARLMDLDILISLRGKRNGSSVFEAARFAGRPVYASLDVAVIRLRRPDQMNALALSFWFNLDSTQRNLSVHRVGSHAFRLPLPALRKFEVPHFTPQSADLFVRAGVAGRKALKLEQDIAARREILLEELMTQAAAQFAGGAGRED